MNTPHHNEYGIHHAEKLLHLAEVKKHQNFLEVGCGNGTFTMIHYEAVYQKKGS
ncbi:hypothetical protein J7K19_00815 [bacterium]|nr:hypothetical protein [bacterium]